MSEKFNTLPVSQKIAVVADISMVIAVIGLIFWTGRQAERLDTVILNQNALSAITQRLDGQVSTISGQMLQMTSAASMAAAEGKLGVLDSRVTTNERIASEFKGDITARLTRIETKLDQRR